MPMWSPVALALALAACGGGGGGSNVRTPPPPPPPPTESHSDPIPFDAHLALTNALASRNAGLTGAGVTIGFVDTGVNRNHPALSGRVMANFVHVGAGNDLTVDDKAGHGTTVAMLAAGRPVGSWPGGIAPDALIVSSRVIADKSPDDDGSGQGNEIEAGQGYGAFFQQVNAELANAGARIINNSWGGLYWDSAAVTREFVDAYRDFVIGRGGLIVFANGNAGDDPVLRANPSDTAALPSKDPYGADLERGWLTVGALDTLHPTQLTDYSQACGVAMNYCLVAPGNVVFTGYDDVAGQPTYWQGGGTSYAAPLVSGAAAVVWSAFPYFNNDLVRQTLLGTAKDLGAAGVDPIFGHGLLDVGKAANGPGKFDWGDVTVSFAGTSTWSNQISGAGGLVKRGTGTLVLSQNNTFTGDTRIEGGAVQLGMGLSGSDVFIGTDGTLQGQGTVYGDVRNDGHFVVSGASGMPLGAGGNYTQGVGGTLDAYIGRGLAVEGLAVLEGGTLNVLGVYSGYTASARETMLHSVAGLTGTFDHLTTAPSVFLEGSLAYDPNNVFLDISRLDVSAAAQAMGLSTASVSAAALVEGAFDALDRGGLVNASPTFLAAAGSLQQAGSAAIAERSLASLSGELHASDGALALMSADDSRRQLEARLDSGLRGGPWAARLGDRRAIGNVRVDMRGWRLGQEIRSGATTWGASLSRGEGTLWHGERFDRGMDLQTEGQVYAFHEFGAGAYLMGRGAFGRLQRNLQREILIGANDYGVAARYTDRYLSTTLQAGWAVPALGGTLVPYVGAQRLHLQRGGFTEDGAAGFGLDVDASRLNASQALWGVRFGNGWRIGPARVDLHGRVEWLRTLAQDGAIQATFTGLQARTPLVLDAIGRATAVVEVGLGTTWGRNHLGLGLDARRTDRQSDLGAFASWSVAF